MKISRLSMMTAIAAASVSLAACSDNDADDTATTATVAPDAAMTTDASAPMAGDHASQFLTDAMKGDNSEVRVGQLAAEKGSTQGVKDYGKMLADDHGAHLTKVTALAQKMGVPTTSETKPEADELYNKLQGLSGADFDREFVAGMVKDHKKDIAAYQAEADSNDAPEVTGMAADTVPTLKKHLETAQSLQSGG